MPNDGVCPIQVFKQDADMAENINFNGYSSKMAPKSERLSPEWNKF